MKLSVYLIVKNEASRLAKTLEQAKRVADEIIVVDSGSTDNTLEIAKSFGAKTEHHNWNSYCDQKHYAETLCSNDWVLMIDADEVLSDELVAEINDFKKSKTTKFVAYNLKISNVFPYDEKPPFFAETFNVVRLYNKKICTLPPDKQNKDRVFVPQNEKIGQLKKHIYHYSLLDVEHAIDKYNKHSSELQRMFMQKNRTVSVFRLFIEFPYQFFRYYILHRFFLNGAKGFTQAMILTIFRWLKIAKIYQFQNKKVNNGK